MDSQESRIRELESLLALLIGILVDTDVWAKAPENIREGLRAKAGYYFMQASEWVASQAKAGKLQVN